MTQQRRLFAAATFVGALSLPSVTHGVEMIEGQWSPLAGGIAGTSTVPTGLVWDRDGSMWACGPDLVQAGAAHLRGIGRFDSATGWSFPGRDSWLLPNPASTVQKLNIQNVALGPDGAIWALGDSGFVSTRPILRSFTDGRWKSEASNLGCANESFACPLTGVHFDDRGTPLITGTFSVSKTDTARPGIARRIAGTWQRIEIPTEALPESVIPLRGDSLAIGGRGFWIWDGVRWSPSGMDSASTGKIRIHQLFRQTDGSVLALARGEHGNPGFSEWGLSNDLARWDGVQWSDFVHSTSGALPINPTVVELSLDEKGNPLIIGSFPGRDTDPAYHGLARWNGQSWDTLARPKGRFSSLKKMAVDSRGRIALAGNFNRIGDVPAWNVAIKGNEGWRATDSGFAGTIQSVAVDRTGAIVVGGYFGGVQGKPIANIARWDGKTWNGMAEGLDSAVFSVAAHPDGGIVASGSFRRSGNDSLGSVARFDGTRWRSLAPTSPDPLYLAFGPDGGIWAARNEGNLVQRWNGSTWAPVMEFDAQGDNVFSIAVAANGEARLVGNEYTDEYRPRIWAASTTTKSVNITPGNKFYSIWTVNDVVALGDSVFAYAGRFCDSCPLALEDHGTWKTMPSLEKGLASAITADPQGILYAAITSSREPGAPFQLLRQAGPQATAFKGLEGGASLVALDSAGSVVVVGPMSGKGGATVYLLENARSVGVVGPSARPNLSVFQARGREWITTRSGRLDIFSPSGAKVWSGWVEAGFSTKSVPLKSGLHLARLGAQTVRILSAAPPY